ncbi:MAG: Na/Pi cotransporter family protein [Deltaproteobacteria bacterium]|nr:Na/Pi cotransporter family protein [Deltaproteobacteria bacterium]
MKEMLLLTASIVLFLIGMMKLSALVQRLITLRIRTYIKYAVRKPVYGLLTGVATTVLFQSSSATTLLTIGMVSAGLISFFDSLGIILGADIGTTLTVQLVVWKITDLSPLFIICGGLLWLSGKPKWKLAGEAAFFFGLMFFGLSLVALATAPLKDTPLFIVLFQETANPLPGFFLGLVFTGIVQASAIPISILVILAQQDLMTIGNALPVVFGANVGTTVTACMAWTVADIDGRRTALAHFIFKAVGAIICLAIMPAFIALLREFSGSAAQQIALGHFFFNILIVAIFLFLLGPVARLLEKILPGKTATLPLWPEFLDDDLLNKPDVALGCVRKELQREIILAQEMVRMSLALIDEYREATWRSLQYIEMVVDNLRMEIVRYLRRISCQTLSEPLSTRLFVYTGMVDDIERIGDHANDLASLSKDKQTRDISFSEAGKKDLDAIARMVSDNLRDAVSLMEKKDEEKINGLYLREDAVDMRVKTAVERHLIRFHRRICQAEAGPIFVEMLLHLERISDHCENIAEYVSDLKDPVPE